MIEYNQSRDGSPEEGDHFSFKVLGVGGSGANVLDRLALEGSDDAQLVVLNTDIRKLSSSVSSQKIQLGSALLKGMGTGGDPDLGKQAALEAADEIREAIRGNDMVFVCVGLGGGTGSGAAPEICRIAKEEGVFLVAYGTLPFEFEGARRMEQARDALSLIEGYANAVVTFDNDRMGELIVPKDGVTQAFAAADKIISQSIRATMNLVAKPGIIRIGMDDLLTALNSEDSRCLFGYGQAKGENRALEAVEQTLKCPLLDSGKLLSIAQNVLIQVSGSDSMTLLEVQTVMKALSSHLRPSAHVLFGTGTDTRLGSSLAVTVISSLDAETLSATSSKPAQTQDAQAQAGQPKKQFGVQPVAAAAVPVAAVPASASTSAPAEPAVAAPAAPAAQGQLPAPVASEPADSKVVSIADGLQKGQSAGVVAPMVAQQPQEVVPTPVVQPEVAQAPVQLEPQALEPAVAASPEPAPVAEEPQPTPAPVVEDPFQQQVPPAAAAAPTDQGADPIMPFNPIASAMQGAPSVDNSQMFAGQQEQPPAIQPTPLQPPAETEQPLQPMIPTPEEPAALADEAESQTISLSRIVPGQTTQRILNRPQRPDEAPVAEQQPMEEAQEEVLKLEPIESKGRFARNDNNVVAGEDLDVPTFLRKKG